MSNKNRQEERKELSKEHRTLAKNSLYSIIFSYSNFFFSIITASLMARLISKEDWAFLLLSLSLIGFFSVLLALLPPSLGYSLVYYVSHFKALGQNNKARSFVKNSLLIRIIFMIPVFFLSILIFTVFLEFFQINLHEFYYLFYLLTPLIIVNGLSPILNDLYRSLNMFKTTLYLLIIKNIVYIVGLLFLFFFIQSIQVSYIAIILVISSIIPLIISSLLLIIAFRLKLKRTEEEGVSLRECIKSLYKYGSYLSISDVIGTVDKELKTQLVGLYEVAGTVTGYHIALQYVSVSHAVISPLNRPLFISFTRLYSKNKIDNIQKIYNTTFNYFLFLILLFTGILFFPIDIFLSFIYGESYLIFSLYLKVFLIATVFTLQPQFLGAYLGASNRVKYISIINLVSSVIRLAFFTYGLVVFNLVIGIFLFLIANIIIFILLTLILNKFKIKLKPKKPILLYSNFFISLITSLGLELLILGDLNLFILTNLNLLIFQKFNIFTLIIFLAIFISLNIIFKVFTHSDIQTIESLMNKDIYTHRIVRRGLSLLKKIVYE